MYMYITEQTYLGVLVNLKRVDSNIEGRDLGDVVVLAFTLLLLELERDTTDWAFLNTLHQMCGETRNLVTKAF